MPLPAIAAAARIGTTALKGGGKSGGMLSMLGGGGSSGTKPHISSVEGTIMIIVAVLVELVNIILVLLDFVFGFGTMLAIPLNIVASIFIGGWLWTRTGSLPLKKTFLPLALNSLPIIRLVPFWFISVWTSLEKGSPPPTKDLRQAESDKSPQPPTKDLRQAK